MRVVSCTFFFFQAEDGIRDLVRSRGLGDVYKRQHCRQCPLQKVRRTYLLDRDLDLMRLADVVAVLHLSLIHI